MYIKPFIHSKRCVPELIRELDRIVGKKRWDILFTDPDTKGKEGNYIPCYSYAWRPDLPSIDLGRFQRRHDIGRIFRKVGARYGSYSMLVRRSGMKKLLDFFEERFLFLPFDMEYTFPVQMHLLTLQQDVVSTMAKALSDNEVPTYTLHDLSPEGEQRAHRIFP